jgi:CheY-like chemotaxis protein
MRAACSAGRPFDIALIDMQMPDMDGIELTTEVRRDPALCSLPLVMLTSLGVNGGRDAALAAGVNGYLNKPVRQSHLYNMLSDVLCAADPGRLADGTAIAADDASRSVAAASATAASPDVAADAQDRAEDALPDDTGDATPDALALPAPALRRPLVLVAEDNVVNQKVATRLLERLGYRADVVANGVEALEALARIPYAAVLMDCQMPEMDGYSATVSIRTREGQHLHTPIIAMTANAMAGDRERALAAGMDDYVTKPVKVETLRAAMERWIPHAQPAG